MSKSNKQWLPSLRLEKSLMSFEIFKTKFNIILFKPQIKILDFSDKEEKDE